MRWLIKNNKKHQIQEVKKNPDPDPDQDQRTRLKLILFIYNLFLKYSSK
jgi:hypothetical protein